ncbi:MAG: Tn3 family transposase [Verrucomicrobia bacterium]|nr:Tn3 family transposase [Verrucomicrobiota bacterium]
MGQLYASLKTSHVTASVALKRLVGFSVKNRYRANRDLGRIFKTEFILQYLLEPELHRRIRRGLLKVEQLHALAGGRLLRTAGPDQCPRAMGADEHLQLPEPDPGLHRLLPGVRDLSGPEEVRPARQWNRSPPAGTRQPN